MSAAEKRLALKKLLVLIALLRRRIQKQKYRKRFWVRRLFEEQNEKGQLKKSFRLRSNMSTLLIQRDIICGTDNAFPMVKSSNSIPHEHGNKIA